MGKEKGKVLKRNACHDLDEYLKLNLQINNKNNKGQNPRFRDH